MMRNTLAFMLVLILVASVASATPVLQKEQIEFRLPPMLDTFDDTILYDNNQSAWWYGGQTNFSLATRFTPLTQFECQMMMVALTGAGGTIQVSLCEDDAGLPGDALWGPTAMAIPSGGTWYPQMIDTNETYMFAGGEDFWLTLDSPGPPYEVFDQAPVIPQRSYLWFSTSTAWAPSPGDNFIRAVGEYSGAIIDVSVDSVWHGQNFFVPNGTSFQVGAKVKNQSPSAPATFAVGCHIYTEIDDVTYTLFDSLEHHTVMLAPGASTNVTFDSYTWNTDNRYRIDVIAYYTGDVNLGNNEQSTETQVFSPPPPNVELRYDDTSPDGSAYTSTVGDAWGMKYDPHMTGEYGLASISVMANGAVGDLPARIRVLDDNGDAPGTILWETTTTMSTGMSWNNFNVGVNVTGAFYIMYVFENGASTSALSHDGYPNTGMAWSYSATTGYESDPGSNDWAMRATLGEVGTYPEVVVDLTYVSGSPVPSGGGNLTFDVYVANNSGASQDFDAWIDIEFEGGAPTTVVNRSFTNYQAGWTINRPNMFFPIPGSYAAGNYEFIGRVGDYSSPVWDEDSFPFTKSGVSDGSAFVPFVPAGVENPFDHIDMGGVASEFALVGNYPNPFNPTTTISYTIGNADNVTLSVFDVSGREVATLVDGYRNAGAHEVVFDASQLASGVYIYRLTSGGQTVSAKMILMK